MSSFSTKTKQNTQTNGHSRRVFKLRFYITGIIFFFLIAALSNSPLSLPENTATRTAPHASIRTITGNVTLSSLNTTTATYGDQVILYGHAETWNESILNWEPYAGEIYLVVNNIAKHGITTTSNGLGNFQLPFTVENDWSATVDVKIEANITDLAYDTFCYDQLYLDVDATALIELDDDLLPGLEGQAYENYPIIGEVRLNSGLAYAGPSFEIEFWYGDYGTGTYYRNITVNGQGKFLDFVAHNPSFSYYTLHWDGNSEVLGDTQQYPFNTINGIVIDWDIPNRVYVNQSYAIGLTVHQNTDPNMYLGRSNVTVFLTGPGTNLNRSFNLSALGELSISHEFQLEGTYTLRVVVNYYHSEYGDEPVPSTWTAQTTITVRIATAFTNFPWQFIVIGVSAVGVVVGIFFLQRWLMKRRTQKDRSTLAREIEERLNNVKLLYKMGRLKEAIAYLYTIYVDLAQFRYGVEKQASQTTTEFAIIMVKQFGTNPQNIYPFIQEIEQVVYGGYPFNDQVFMHSIELFGRIYLELMEKPLPSFQI